MRAHKRNGTVVCPGKRKDTMKKSTKDRIEGKYHEAKGAIKEKVGSATDNPDLYARGRDEKVAGKVQSKVGQVEKTIERS
jgi:uncharacterized protein YjbJ (UPF0337 family)